MVTSGKLLYVVTGSTGNIGRKLTEKLLKNGKRVRVIGRDPARLEPLVNEGAEAYTGFVNDSPAMVEAFKEANAVFTLIPPNYSHSQPRSYQNKVSESFFAAIRINSVQYVVNLSSVGAHLPDKAGPINGLHDNEERLNKLSGTHVLHLRPAFFMENLLFNIDLIRTRGINGSPLRGDLKLPVIATQDIADFAAERLMNLDFSGKSTQELLGQRSVGMEEATRVIGAAIGRPDLRYVQFPYEEAQKAMVEMGFSPESARLMVEMDRGLNEGLVKPLESRSPKNTTPTSIETFAKEVFARAYEARQNAMAAAEVN